MTILHKNPFSWVKPVPDASSFMLSFSNFNEKEPVYNFKMRDELTKIAEKYGMAVSTTNTTQLDDSVTHMVCPPESRTNKVLSAIVSGRWVVTPDWLYESDKMGEILPAENFGGRTDNVLRDKKVFVTAHFQERNKGKTPDKLGSLIHLVELGKGKMEKDQNNANFIISEQNQKDPDPKSSKIYSWNQFLQYITNSIKLGKSLSSQPPENPPSPTKISKPDLMEIIPDSTLKPESKPPPDPPKPIDTLKPPDPPKPTSSRSKDKDKESEKSSEKHSKESAKNPKSNSAKSLKTTSDTHTHEKESLKTTVSEKSLTTLKKDDKLLKAEKAKSVDKHGKLIRKTSSSSSSDKKDEKKSRIFQRKRIEKRKRIQKRKMKRGKKDLIRKEEERERL